MVIYVYSQRSIEDLPSLLLKTVYRSKGTSASTNLVRRRSRSRFFSERRNFRAPLTAMKSSLVSFHHVSPRESVFETSRGRASQRAYPPRIIVNKSTSHLFENTQRMFHTFSRIPFSRYPLSKLPVVLGALSDFGLRA